MDPKTFTYRHLNLFNALLDWHCDEKGVRETIQMLFLDFAFTEKEILALDFDPKDVEAVETQLFEEGKLSNLQGLA